MSTSSFTMAGGGVRGKDAGIDHATITQAGATIATFHLFIEGSPEAGEMTLGNIVGKAINGTTSAYNINRSSGTGGTGKRISIGKNNRPGASKVCSHDTPGHK
jgi:hypothetical protein